MKKLCLFLIIIVSMLLCSCGAPNTYGDKGRESLSESAVPSDTEQRRTAPPSLSQEKAGPSATMETGLEYGRISGCCIVEPWDERLCSTALLFISRTDNGDGPALRARLAVEKSIDDLKGEYLYVDFEDIPDEFSGRHNLMYQRVGGGCILFSKRTIGHGSLESMLAAYYDEEGLYKIRWPFSDCWFYGEKGEFLSLKWTGRETFVITCRGGAQSPEYVVNTQLYKEATGLDFDREGLDFEISELSIGTLDREGSLTVSMMLNYGVHTLTAVQADVLLKFDEKTHSMLLQSIEYGAVGDAAYELKG